MNPDTTVIRPRFVAGQCFTEPGGRSFVHPATGLRYALNETGRAILESLSSEMTVSAMSNRLAGQFEVAETEASRAVQAFVAEIHELGLVELTEPGEAAALRARYLDLLRRALVNLIYPEHELRIELLESGHSPAELHARDRVLRDIRYQDGGRHFAALVAAKQDGSVWRGRPWRFSHTMVGMRRLEHLQWCAERVFEDGIDGDFLEAGVCQGGASILMRALQVAHGEPHRRTWLADSFEGLPVPSHEADANYDFSESRQPWLACSRDAVEDNFRTYDLMSAQVVFIPGWFRDTLPSAPVPKLAILRIDADLYDSTREVLTGLYDRVSPGGFVIIDDYDAFAPCRLAVREFRTERGITEPIRHIDRMAVYWRKAS